MGHVVKVLSVTPVTHDVHCIRMEKPQGYKFVPGQATDVAINKEEWKEEKRPFTFTCLNEESYLEFTIKSYNDHDGVTKQIGLLKAGDELILDEPWGAIEYKGPGYFIAGGAGITPFIAILRQLHKENAIGNNELFFSNKTFKDIIYQEELSKILHSNVHYILTREDHPVCLKGPIDKEFINREIKDFTRHFYICGPDKMIADLVKVLTELGARPDSVVFEK